MQETGKEKNAELPRKPFVFLSSLTREFGGWLPDGSIDKSSLRYKAFLVGEDVGKAVWIAEVFRPDLRPPKEQMEIVDALWENVRSCEVFICLLGGNRRGDDDHGTRVIVDKKVSAVSYFESEIVLAALLAKPIEVFVANGFDSGPRLASLLEMLRFALPPENWRGPLAEKDILKGIRSVLQAQRAANLFIPSWTVLLRRRVAGWLLAKMYSVRGIREGRPPGQRAVFFNDRVCESRTTKLDKEFVESMLDMSQAAPLTEGKLARLYIALRELMAQPYWLECPPEFLLLWNDALTKWASSTAWYGLHGHTFLGHLAALYSISEVREKLRTTNASMLTPDQIEHPVSLAGGLYSTARLMPSRYQRKLAFEDGLAHLNQTIRERGGLSANLAQMRGSFYLRLGETTRAVENYEDALRRRFVENAGDGQIGESMSELGYAYLWQMKLFKGRELLEEGAKLLEKGQDGSPGFYVRALRKLAVGYAATGRPWKAYEKLTASRNLARQKQLFDQIR